ncbi:MAG: glycogen debranching protein GlgX [Propionibacteriaceae bacterium]|jgi:glycogen operon protein|nr:glycogen debranching protein GlgX [Propionibacteriaceae bacterium]
MLGAHADETGTDFSLWAPRASGVELALVDRELRQTNHDMAPSDEGVWRVRIEGCEPGQRYGFRAHGPWDPNSGERFNPAKLLVDPYARAITGGVDYSGPIFDHTAESNFAPDLSDSFAAVPLSVVVGDSPAPKPLAQKIPLSQMVIYETHVRGYTRQHPAVPEHLRGTYGGLAYPNVIDHLKDIGVNAIELLPVQHFISEPFVVGRGLTNYWGYNTLGFFAPHAAYASAGTLGEQVVEFKQMVEAFHEAGIAVILDVVYNHTGEGGHEGPTLCFRGLDHGTYYRLTYDQRNDYDTTGCGNAVDTSNPVALQLVMDSLRYWVTQMGVDGFRFDLATTLVRDERHYVDQNHPFKQLVAADEVLRETVMIAEPWDLGPYGYQVGSWGVGWSEWNDRFRDYTRDFWRGATSGVQELATRLTGSADIFNYNGRPATSSVNFVTAHDGFTLRDVVTYDLKHNEANRERNRDGANENRSWNHGWEGETDKADIVASRQRTARNILAQLLLSTGVPMITAGDEMGRTQEGNNNAYCLDSPLSWVDWNSDDVWSSLTDLTRTLLKLRAEHPLLRSATFRSSAELRDANGIGLGRCETAWFSEFGQEMTQDQWHDMGRRFLGMYLSNMDEAFLVFFHGGWDPVQIAFPDPHWGTSYKLEAHTGLPEEFAATEAKPGDVWTLPARTVAVFSATVLKDALDVKSALDASARAAREAQQAQAASSGEQQAVPAG